MTHRNRETPRTQKAVLVRDNRSQTDEMITVARNGTFINNLCRLRRRVKARHAYVLNHPSGRQYESARFMEHELGRVRKKTGR